MNPRADVRSERAKTGLPTGRPGRARSIVPADELHDRRVGVGRQEKPPIMRLAFALMAAINGSTGSCATLSHGL